METAVQVVRVNVSLCDAHCVCFLFQMVGRVRRARAGAEMDLQQAQAAALAQAAMIQQQQREMDMQDPSSEIGMYVPLLNINYKKINKTDSECYVNLSKVEFFNSLLLHRKEQNASLIRQLL